MKSINLYIKENVKSIGKNTYVRPDIPENKLNNVIKAFKCEDFHESILAIYDDTFLGSSDEGLVFTGEKFIFKEDGEEPIVFIYSDIKSANYIKNEKDNTSIVLNNGNVYTLSKPKSGDFSHKELAKFLQTIIKEFDDYKEENQLKEIADMSESLKKSYLKIIVNMTFIDDNQIDEKELAELFLLMTRLRLNKESRFDIRQYITQMTKENIEDIENLLEIIKNNCEASLYTSIIVSLVKDLINVYFSSKDTVDKDNFEFLNNHKELFGISEEKIDVVYSAIENDYKIVNNDLDDDDIKKNAKELAAKAVATGTPIAAVYLSGSVIGMSAAGVTSGLAGLGLGMGMSGGLAVIGLIGVVSYKGVRHLTGADELTKYKIREMMLHDVIVQTQKTISLIIDDVNYIVQKLNDAVLNHDQQADKIKKLTFMIAHFQGALKSVDTKSNLYQNSANRLQNPKILDEVRLKSLTEDGTKKQLYDFIIVNYEEEDKKLLLKKDVPTETLDEMAKIFQTLKYFDMKNIATSKVTSTIKGLLG